MTIRDPRQRRATDRSTCRAKRESMTGPAATSSALAGDYEMDPAHSRLGFVARHTIFTKVHGQFNEFEAMGILTPKMPQARAHT